MTFINKIHNYFRASYPLLLVQTHEEDRVQKEIIDFYEGKEKVKTFIWDVMNGLQKKEVKVRNEDKVFSVIKDTNKYQEIFNKIAAIEHERCIFLMKDFHPYIEFPGIVRAIRNTIPILKARGSIVIFVTPVAKLPPELEKEIQFVDFSLPDEKAIETQLTFIKTCYEKDKSKKLNLSDQVQLAAITAAKGMTVAEVQNAFSLSLMVNDEFNSSFVSTVFEEKIEKVKKSGLLNYIEPNLSFNDVGGLDGLKKWTLIRAKAFTPEAKKYGLRYAKGMLLCGYPGVGKTLIAKATAKEFNAPLFQLDVGGLFGKHVGETEENFRKVIKIVDAIGPCVLFLDEIEKALNRDAVSGRGDTGTSSRSFGSLLSWMSDRESPVFVIGTSNNHTVLPPEFVRKGRFDELFWIDLPNPKEREDIWKVLITRNNREPGKFDLEKLAKATQGFTGSEIEQLIQATMFNCFAGSGKDIATKDLIAEVEEFEPQSKTNEEAFKEMADKAKGKLRMAATITTEAEFDKSLRKLGI
jgi:SpoVK/Ycf46/Vps4 family AAA+-type ATPase